MGRRLLQSERNATLCVDVLRSCMAKRKFQLHAFSWPSGPAAGFSHAGKHASEPALPESESKQSRTASTRASLLPQTRVIRASSETHIRLQTQASLF